jgi:hypothetical protein
LGLGGSSKGGEGEQAGKSAETGQVMASDGMLVR